MLGMRSERVTFCVAVFYLAVVCDTAAEGDSCAFTAGEPQPYAKDARQILLDSWHSLVALLCTDHNASHDLHVRASHRCQMGACSTKSSDSASVQMARRLPLRASGKHAAKLQIGQCGLRSQT